VSRTYIFLVSGEKRKVGWNGTRKLLKHREKGHMAGMKKLEDNRYRFFF